MKLHPTVVEKIMNLFQNYSGHSNDNKLKKMIENLDLSAYTRKEGKQDTVLVLSEDLMKELQGVKRA